jgi:hypothetical protein
VNGDGVTDLITGFVRVFLGNGDGTFRAPKIYRSGCGWLARSLSVADLNGDGVRDLFFTSETGNSLGVLLGTGDGSFLSARFYAAGAQPVMTAPIDFNADGKTDLAVFNYTSKSVTLLINITGSVTVE